MVRKIVDERCYRNRRSGRSWRLRSDCLEQAFANLFGLPFILLVHAHDPRLHFFACVFHCSCLCVDLHLTIFDVVPPDMRRDVQEIFRATPHHKQVMMFSATLAKDIRVTCKKFMANVRPSLSVFTSCSADWIAASGDLR